MDGEKYLAPGIKFVQYLTPAVATARFPMPLNLKKYVISAMRSKQRPMREEGELYGGTNVPLDRSLN
jgi:hypothetical protein